MTEQIWLWIGFNVFVLAMLALDLGVFHRKAHVVSFKESITWTLVWVGLGLLFNGLLGQIGFDYSQFSGVASFTALISGRIYPSLGTEMLLQRGLTALIIAILASFYPAREASLNEPAEALHYV